MRWYYLVLGMVVAACAAGAEPFQNGARDQTDRLAMFLTGCELLKTQPRLDDSTRAVEIGKLEQLSGLNVRKAFKLIRGYRNRPVDWQKVVERMDWYLEQL